MHARPTRASTASWRPTRTARRPRRACSAWTTRSHRTPRPSAMPLQPSSHPTCPQSKAPATTTTASKYATSTCTYPSRTRRLSRATSSTRPSRRRRRPPVAVAAPAAQSRRPRPHLLAPVESKAAAATGPHLVSHANERERLRLHRLQAKVPQAVRVGAHCRGRRALPGVSGGGRAATQHPLVQGQLFAQDHRPTQHCRLDERRQLALHRSHAALRNSAFNSFKTKMLDNGHLVVHHYAPVPQPSVPQPCPQPPQQQIQFTQVPAPHQQHQPNDQLHQHLHHQQNQLNILR